jgi:exodeoxyribonuclease V alpha subunit
VTMHEQGSRGLHAGPGSGHPTGGPAPVGQPSANGAAAAAAPIPAAPIPAPPIPAPPWNALERRFGWLVARAGTAIDPDGMLGNVASELMHATSEGHACLAISSLVRRLDAHGIDVDEEALADLLGRHPWVGMGGGPEPLVFEHERLYLRRHRDAEARLAAAVLRRARVTSRPVENPDGDRQRMAVAHAVRGRLSIITGGPGTGKTTTVARLLSKMAAKDPDIRVALAAPTGKAAARMEEAIGKAWLAQGASDPGASHLKDTISIKGQTLHRLLSYQPSTDQFRRNAADPLEHDVIIVDEASMVPLVLMDALFQAVREDAQLVLLGDAGQLTSVETGAVLADLVDGAGESPVARCVVALDRNYRFDPSRGIGKLARAVRAGDLPAVREVFAEQDPDGSVVRGPEDPGDERWLAEYAEAMRGVLDAAGPSEALRTLAQGRILCATNVGRLGTEAMVRRVESMFYRMGYRAYGLSYRGRPLLVTRNDYALNLFNGDIGVVWGGSAPSGAAAGGARVTDAEAEARAFVSTGGDDAEPRSFPLPQIPLALTAWAMSIHRAQGSEFDEVYVVLPDQDTPVLTRELLYTAITRARTRVVLIGPDSMLERAVGRTVQRESGLPVRLME